MIRSFTIAGLLIVLAGSAYLSWIHRHKPAPAETPAPVLDTADQALLNLIGLSGKLEALQQPLCPPQEEDWLAEHAEDGQTFSEFLEVCPAPIAAELTTFYLQPIGLFTKTQNQLLQETGRGLELFYGYKVVVLPSIALTTIPKSARRINSQTRQLQILTTYVLDEVLKPRRPKDAVAVLALSAPDLWAGKDWNFLFGQASLSDRVGVWSIARFGNPDESTAAYQSCLNRMLGIALHESGHMLGITHCTAWNCCMNGTNNLDESDRHPLWFCAECQPKVWWACSLNPVTQTANMARFAQQRKLNAAAEHWKAVEQKLKATP
jgi:archaemetzincin